MAGDYARRTQKSMALDALNADRRFE